jgi:hypothetical protein
MHHRCRRALRANAADQALFDREGMGPGDAYRALWLKTLEYKEKERNAHEENKSLWGDRFVNVMRMILPFERPRLQAIKVEGDPNKPTMPPEDVAKAMAAVLTKWS